MPDKVGQLIGNYRLVRLLGSGGFADVYLGQHVHLASKQAAVKMLKLFDVDVEKFQEEAETTEKLVHPRIIRLLDFALQEGTPFLVLDYAPGGTLRARHPRGSQLSLDIVVGYLKEITPALQYAHGLNILHRDIKPGNMLIGRQGELLLSDFGMAVLSQTGRTSMQNYNVGGTPFYMAPEQYRGKPEKASDQYALAIVVYEWLCGTVPFSEGSFIELGYQHTHEPVPPMREKIPSIPPAVEAVVMRALAKDSRQRFGSVQEFSTAFEQACIPPAQPAPSVTEPARPHRAPSTVVPETRAPQPPQPRTTIPAGVQLTTTRPITRRKVLIGLGGAGLAATSIVGWWEYTHGFLIPSGATLYIYRGHTHQVNSVAWSPDGTRIASSSDDHTVQVWDAADGSQVLTYRGHSYVVSSAAWSPDGKRIASGGGNGYSNLTIDNTVQVWDASNGGNVFTYKGHSDSVSSVAWSPDGKRIASGSYDGTVQVWDASNGGNAFTYRGHSDAVYAVTWSPDGKRIASGSGDKTVRVWDAANGGNAFTYRGHTWLIFSVSWSPDGKRIASAGGDSTVQVWDASNGGNAFTYRGHSSGSVVWSVAWSPDGKRIASGSGYVNGNLDHTVQVWQAP